MCVCVGHDREPCKNVKLTQDALRVIISHMGIRNHVLDRIFMGAI